MIHRDATVLQHQFEITVADREHQIPSDRPQDHLGRELPAFELLALSHAPAPPSAFRDGTSIQSGPAAQTCNRSPVNVDAIIFWHVHDARKAALEITNYREAIDRVAQTSLREMIGSSMLSALLSDRKAADDHLREVIGQKTADWGVTVRSVEIRDVAIPVALQDAMSRQAQAEREKQARVILGSAEAEIAGKFVEAAKVYADHPAALQLRAMNIIYETTKERGTTILMPTSMVDSMNPAAALSLAGQAPALKSVA